MADQAVTARRAAEEQRISELRKKLEIDDAIDTPISSLRERIYSSLRSYAEQMARWADSFGPEAKPTTEILEETRKALDLVLSAESLNHIEAGTFGPETTDLASEPIGETVNGCLVLGGLAEQWALDALSEKAGSILEEGGHFVEEDLGERVAKVERAYREAAPYMLALDQIFDAGIEDADAAQTLYYCLRELIERYEGKVGEDRRRLLAARTAGEDQLARETEEVCEEEEAKAVFAHRIYETVEKFWVDLKGAPEPRWRDSFIKVAGLDSRRRIAELDERMEGKRVNADA